MDFESRELITLNENQVRHIIQTHLWKTYGFDSSEVRFNIVDDELESVLVTHVKPKKLEVLPQPST